MTSPGPNSPELARNCVWCPQISATGMVAGAAGGAAGALYGITATQAAIASAPTVIAIGALNTVVTGH
jgi:hypothetical protein